MNLLPLVRFLCVTCVICLWTQSSSVCALDALVCGFGMAPQIPRTNVFSLESTQGLSLSHNSGLGLPEPVGVQSCFAISETTAEDQSLHWHRRAGAVYGGQGTIFVHIGLNDTTQLGSCAAVASAAGGSLGHISASICNRAPLSHGYKIEGTPQSGLQDAIEDR